MRTIAFTKRTIKELLRDPLSYIFCLGFPMIMLIIMTVVDQSIPAEGNVEVFHIWNLAPGIALFGLTFIMLFTAIQVSKDRATALLMRLYASPMKAVDFIVGYTLPVMVIAVVQSLITFVVSAVIGTMIDYQFAFGRVIIAILALIPSAFLFIGFGLFFGTLLNDKAAPGVCSIIITLSCMLGGVWMDVDLLGGVLQDVAHALPFYQGTMAARYGIAGDYGELLKPFLITMGYGVVIYVLSIWLFYKKMQQDIK